MKNFPWRGPRQGASGRPPAPPEPINFTRLFWGVAYPSARLFLAPSAPENTFHKISMRLHLYSATSYFPVNIQIYLPIFPSLIIHSVRIKNPSTHLWPTVKLTKQEGVWGSPPPSSPLKTLAVLNRLSRL